MGQINIDSKFGKYLYEIASDNQYKTFLEVGTWNGKGTTYCLMNGILYNNPTAKLYSLEINSSMYNEALQFWVDKPSQLHLILGALHKKSMSIEEIQAHPKFEVIYNNHKDAYKNWLREDIEHASKVEIFNLEEKNIDVIVLDGGEFSTHEDWNILKQKNPKVVCLDDSQVVKTYLIRDELINSPDWELVIDQPQDRNGWCVFKRK